MENGSYHNPGETATGGLPNPAQTAWRVQKYQIAAYCFLASNIAYLILFWIFIPPFNMGRSAVLSLAGILALFVVLTIYIHRGRRLLTRILAVVYAGRSAFSIYSIAIGDAFQVVPYVLPLMILTFYFLARAGWDWP